MHTHQTNGAMVHIGMVPNSGFTDCVKKNENKEIETMEVLNSVFLKSIKMLNPAMPHITEEIWETFNNEVLISNKWPEKYNINENVLIIYHKLYIRNVYFLLFLTNSEMCLNAYGV